MCYLSEDCYNSRLKNCNNKYVLIECRNCGQKYLIPLHCGMRTCPECAKRFSNNLADDIWNIVRDLPITRYKKLRHVVLTFGTEGGLERRVRKAFNAWRKIWNAHLKGKGNGAFVFLEFGGKNRSVHLHILFYGEYIPYSELKRWWFELTGKFIVHVNLVQGRGAVKEVCKYVSKGLGEDSEEDYKIESSLFGHRRVRRYGLFRGKRLIMNRLKCPVCGGYAWKRLENGEGKPLIFDASDIRKLEIGVFLLAYKGAVFKVMASKRLVL